MDRINPAASVYQTMQIKPTESGKQRQSVGQLPVDAPGNRGTGQVSVPAEKGNSTGNHQLLVPVDERLSKLENIYDEKTLKRMGVVECATCASRTYQDKSDDPGVSFQAPTHLSPGQAASAVVAHEMEHVVNEQAQAKEEGKEVVGQSVQIFRSVCPECGKSYVSGGLTKTTTASRSESYEGNAQAKATGNLLDIQL